ncbi:PfkB family carbohydrate kinase [Palleronia sp. LCG004]|uniref:PfkB family carbohydrate kinase n=1 Tax=Palleronia sp. LCG004 TaxID=3079304 RepID=UPI00294357CB|nr:PfkB family carbohydrate kinase [Palleronia sp. LCG004]WOI58222.1 PfkB family carbohydrate kinase [Palleronia sp. LCG004]
MVKAYVVGNVALDETLSVADLPAPGASIFGATLSHDLGGKGANQAIALARAGIACRLIAAVGSDARAAEIAQRLAAEPLEVELVEIADVASDFSIILMAERGENAVITTREAATALSPGRAVPTLGDAARGDLLVMQGNLSGGTTAALLREARARGMRIAVNPSPLQPYFAELWPLVDMAFVNEGEAAALGGVEALRDAGVGQLVLTLGEAGAELIDADGCSHVPACPCRVVDTTGAGDSFMAVALASALGRGGRLDPLALAHGARAAAHTVAQAGTVAAFPDVAGMAEILARREA